LNKCIRKIKTESKNKVIDEKERLNAYFFVRDFHFEVKDIITVYRTAIDDFCIGGADKGKLGELINWYKDNQNMNDSIRLAAAFYYLFISTRPFIRNNQYMAQILMNTILSRQGYPPIVIPLWYRIEFLGSKEKPCAAVIEEFIRNRLEKKMGLGIEKETLNV